MPGEYKYLFGPVPSRRLGLSLGVDIVPLKTCTQNCIYCQLGVNGKQTLKRDDYVPVKEVLTELKRRIAEGLKADFITLSGSGEPTLHNGIGRVIDGIREITKIPVAVITNGTLLSESAVRSDCAKADVVLPSLDAGDEKTFRRINCPHSEIDFTRFVEGLCKFRQEFSGQIWLEIFLVDGINTNNEQIEKIKSLTARIGPDKIQLNTAVRPTAEPSVSLVDIKKLNEIAQKFGPSAEAVADFEKVSNIEKSTSNVETILEMLRRRPCSLADISASLEINRNQALKYLQSLQSEGLIETQTTDNQTFFRAK
jgi:wyosine [tRNA(Phe)-imidazoG37] synthetase (radical SAM superfamily)